MFMKIKRILITGLLQHQILSSSTQVIGKKVEGRKLQNLIKTAVEKGQHPQVVVVREYFLRAKPSLQSHYKIKEMDLVKFGE